MNTSSREHHASADNASLPARASRKDHDADVELQPRTNFLSTGDPHVAALANVAKTMRKRSISASSSASAFAAHPSNELTHVGTSPPDENKPAAAETKDEQLPHHQDLDAPMSENAKDEARAYWQHAVGRTPLLLAKVALFAPYATLLAKIAVSKDGDASGRIKWLAGFNLLPTSYVAVYTTVLTLITAVLAPPLGAIADYTHHRKNFVAVLSGLAAGGAVLMIFTWPSTWYLAGILAIISGLGYETALVMLNGFLADMKVNNKQRSRVSRNSVTFGSTAQILVNGVLTALIIVFALPGFNVDGGDFDSASDVALWRYRHSNGTDMGICSPDTCVLQLTNVATAMSNWIVIDVPAADANTGYGFALFQRVELNQRLQGRGIYVNANIAAVVEGGETTAGGRLLRGRVGFVYLAQGRVVGHDLGIDGAAVTDNNSESSSRDRYLAHAGNIPPNTDTVQVELLLSGPGRIQVKNISTFSAPDFWVPLALALAGMWFILFAALSYRNLHAREASRQLPETAHNYVTAGFSRLFQTIRRANKYPHVIRFLIALSLFSNGVGAVIAVVGLLLSEILGLGAGITGLLLLATQTMSIPGAIVFHKLGKRIGFSRSLAVSYFTWTVGLVLAFLLLVDSSSVPYVAICFPLIGLSIGGSSAQAKAVFSTLVPVGQESEFFGLYLFAQLCLGWLGSLSFVVVNEAFNSLRAGVLFQAVFILPAAFIQSTIPEIERNSFHTQ